MTQRSNETVMGVPSTMNDDFQLNIKVLVDRGIKIQPDTPVVTLLDNDKEHYMTLKEMQYRATKIASSLSKHGIKPGDRIGTFMFDNARNYILMYAVPCMGCVIHGINIRLHSNDLSYIITHSNDKILFIDADLLPIFEKIPQNAFKNVKKFIICGKNLQV